MSESQNGLATGHLAQYYLEKLPDDIGPFRELLQNYSRIPVNDVDNHLHTIRDRAWSVVQYPCVGMWSFTKLKYFEDPIFDTVVARLKQPESNDAFLDVACGLGQVPRKLAADGVDPTKLYGTDLLSEYLEIGFDLFRDVDRFPKNHIVAADLLKPEAESMAALGDKMTFVHAANFFHLFDWEKQVLIARNVLKFLKPGADAVIFGGQIGRLNASEISSKSGRLIYLHNEKSMQDLWKQIGDETATQWRVEFEWLGKIPFEMPGYPEDTRYLRCAVYRV